MATNANLANLASRVPVLLAADARNILRDPMLRFLALYPLIIGLMLRVLIPAVTHALANRLDLTLLLSADWRLLCPVDYARAYRLGGGLLAAG